jgi:CBS domain-containing protein
MNVAEIMKTEVASCHASETAAVAAERMWLRDVGCLAVLDEHGHVVGMVTDRDLCMAAYTQGKPLFAIPVSIAMSREVYACLPSDSVQVAEETMRIHQVRRLPVIDRHGHLRGVLSLNDLARLAKPGATNTGVTERFPGPLAYSRRRGGTRLLPMDQRHDQRPPRPTLP